LAQAPVPIEHIPITERVCKFRNSRVQVGIIQFRMPVAKYTFDVFMISRALGDDFMQDQVFGRTNRDNAIL
jgi:hypothetical protein